MGTSQLYEGLGSNDKDHPHACGDKKRNCAFLAFAPGSSPRVWGQGIYGQCVKSAARIIPTRMGTSPLPPSVTRFRLDHPHAYGDKRLSLTGANFCRGSSPRVWGQVSFSTSARRICKDHPHAYGDKQFTFGNIYDFQGSSPRVWRQEENNYSHKITSRIIPTRMGTRFPVGSFERKGQDHPHAYGDKMPLLPKSQAKKGSSPRVWGQVVLYSSPCVSVGIIPMRMGTSADSYCI